MNAFILGVEDVTQTHHWLWPEGYELLWAGTAQVLIITLLFWKVGPMVRKSLAARTARVQAELDSSAQALATAEEDAASVRRAIGNIDEERRRVLAEADEQAAAVVESGRARLDEEVAEMDAKAGSDIDAAGGRVSDELRSEISRLAAAAADRVVERSLDEDTRQRLIEDYIQRVGASA